jgi:hypothetical protein
MPCRSQTGVLDHEQRASQTFLERVLRPDRDQAFVAHFDERVEILQSLTSSRTDLAAALERLSIPGHYATLIFSAVRECAEGVMRQQPGDGEGTRQGGSGSHGEGNRRRNVRGIEAGVSKKSMRKSRMRSGTSTALDTNRSEVQSRAAITS